MGMDARITDELPFAVTWVVKEPMRRASHALVADGRVWLVDPVAWEPALERVAALGRPAGVLMLLDRHNRDAAVLAQRLEVPLLRLPQTLPDTPFELHTVLDRRGWHERALWWPEHRLLLVPEAIGTAPFFTLGAGPAGVHALLRLTPPRSLARFSPEHLLVGHGPSVHDGATPALHEALARSRRDIPRALTALPRMLRGG